MLMDHSPFRVAIGPSSRSRIAPDVVPIRPAGPRCGRGVIVAGGSPVNPEEIAQRLELLRIEHLDLDAAIIALAAATVPDQLRSEEHTSELQSLMRISYAVFCLKKTQKTQSQTKQ